MASVSFIHISYKIFSFYILVENCIQKLLFGTNSNFDSIYVNSSNYLLVISILLFLLMSRWNWSKSAFIFHYSVIALFQGTEMEPCGTWKNFYFYELIIFTDYLNLSLSFTYIEYGISKNISIVIHIHQKTFSSVLNDLSKTSQQHLVRLLQNYLPYFNFYFNIKINSS